MPQPGEYAGSQQQLHYESAHARIHSQDTYTSKFKIPSIKEEIFKNSSSSLDLKKTSRPSINDSVPEEGGDLLSIANLKERFQDSSRLFNKRLNNLRKNNKHFIQQMNPQVIEIYEQEGFLKETVQHPSEEEKLENPLEHDVSAIERSEPDDVVLEDFEEEDMKCLKKKLDFNLKSPISSPDTSQLNKHLPNSTDQKDSKSESKTGEAESDFQKPEPFELKLKQAAAILKEETKMHAKMVECRHINQIRIKRFQNGKTHIDLQTKKPVRPDAKEDEHAYSLGNQGGENMVDENGRMCDKELAKKRSEPRLVRKSQKDTRKILQEISNKRIHVRKHDKQLSLKNKIGRDETEQRMSYLDKENIRETTSRRNGGLQIQHQAFPHFNKYYSAEPYPRLQDENNQQIQKNTPVVAHQSEDQRLPASSLKSRQSLFQNYQEEKRSALAGRGCFNSFERKQGRVFATQLSDISPRQQPYPSEEIGSKKAVYSSFKQHEHLMNAPSAIEVAKKKLLTPQFPTSTKLNLASSVLHPQREGTPANLSCERPLKSLRFNINKKTLEKKTEYEESREFVERADLPLVGVHRLEENKSSGTLPPVNSKVKLPKIGKGQHSPDLASVSPYS